MRAAREEVSASSDRRPTRVGWPALTRRDKRSPAQGASLVPGLQNRRSESLVQILAVALVDLLHVVEGVLAAAREVAVAVVVHVDVDEAVALAHYGNEEGVGRGIARAGVPREEVFLTTKLWTADFADAARAIDASLSRLGQDYVDLLLLHHEDANDEQAGFNALHDVRRSVGYVLVLLDGTSVYVTGDTSTTDDMRDGTLAAMGLDYAFWCSDGVYNMGVEEVAQAAMVGAKHNIAYHNSTTDTGERFDREAAERFAAPNAMVVYPGEDIEL